MEYPCVWVYKIIGCDLYEMKRAVLEILPESDCAITFSRSSAGAKYHCLNVNVTVESEAHRRMIYESLSAHRAIKVVL